MSTRSWIVLGSSLTISTGIIGYVHYKQNYDREQLHRGVILDIERQERRKAENLYRLREQIELTKEFKRVNANVIEEKT